MTNKGKTNKAKTYNNNVSNSNSFRNKQYNQFRNKSNNKQTASPNHDLYSEEEKTLKVSSNDLLESKTANNYISIDNLKISEEETRLIELPANISDSTATITTTNENLNEEEEEEIVARDQDLENKLAETTVDKTGTKIIEQIIDELYQSCFDSNNQEEMRQENVTNQETPTHVDDETHRDEEAKSSESVSSLSLSVQTDSTSESNNASKQDEETVIEHTTLEQEETNANLNTAETKVIEQIIDDLYKGCLAEEEEEKQEENVQNDNQIQTDQPQQVELLNELDNSSSTSVSSQEVESNEIVNHLSPTQQEPQIDNINSNEIVNHVSSSLQESQNDNSNSNEINNKNDVNIIEITQVDLNKLDESSESSADLEAETNKINELLQDMTEKIIGNIVKVEIKEHDETSRLINSSVDLDIEKDYVIPSYESLERLKAATSKVQTVTRSSESIQICETPIAPPKKQVQPKKRDHEQEASNSCALCCFI